MCIHPGRVSAQQSTLDTLTQLQGVNRVLAGESFWPNRTMSLHLLGKPRAGSNEDPACMDSSPYGYYMHVGARAGKWVVSIQGGGWCPDVYNCWLRTLDSYVNSTLGITRTASTVVFALTSNLATASATTATYYCPTAHINHVGAHTHIHSPTRRSTYPPAQLLAQPSTRSPTHPLTHIPTIPTLLTHLLTTHHPNSTHPPTHLPTIPTLLTRPTPCPGSSRNWGPTASAPNFGPRFDDWSYIYLPCVVLCPDAICTERILFHCVQLRHTCFACHIFTLPLHHFRTGSTRSQPLFSRIALVLP
jgi:hypothetical protein